MSDTQHQSPRVLSLCSGIGGIDLAAEWAGMEIVGQVEIDPFCCAVLAHHWPDVRRMGDLKEVRGDEFGDVELVVAGFPCQPASHAGKRRGASDDRWLWPDVHRVIQRIQPAWVLLENVSGLISLGLDEVLRDLDSAGYEAWPLVFSVSAVGAPHQRERVFIIGHLAYADDQRQRQPQGRITDQRRWADNGGEDVADATGTRLPHRQHTRQRTDGTQGGTRLESEPERHRTGQAQSCVGQSVDGLPGWLAGYSRWPSGPGQAQHEWEAPRTTTGKVVNRAARLKALGNAVVPQQVYPILAAIAATWGESEVAE